MTDRDLLERMAEALRDLYVSECEYILINHLGDPLHNQRMKNAQEALAAYDARGAQGKPRTVEQVAGLLPEGFCVVQIEPKTEADDDLWYDAAMAYREAVRFNQKGFSEECCRISAAIRVLAAGAVRVEGK